MRRLLCAFVLAVDALMQYDVDEPGQGHSLLILSKTKDMASGEHAD